MTTQTPRQPSPVWRRRRRDFCTAAGLALTAALVWAWTYHRLTPAAWRTPLFLGGDTSLVMSFIEAGAEGGFPPGGFKSAPRLGAPFGAEWNTWPITEELLYWVAGVLSRWWGLPAGSAFVVMLGHALAAAAFFLACRGLGKPRLPSAVFALVFGLSYFIFLRGLGHIAIAHAWAVPLGWLTAAYAFSERGMTKNRRRFYTGLAVGIVTGLQNPYYTFILVQFLGLAALTQLVRPRRSWRTVGAPLLVAAAACAAFAAMQADTLLDRWVHHRGTLSAQRSFRDVELYALKPLDLLLPLHWNVSFLASRAKVYVQQRVVSGEFPMAFLGVVGVAGALWLAAVVFRDLAGRGGRLSAASRRYAVPATWVIGVGVVGGVLAMGSLLTGASFLRGADRFSVVILMLALLFLTDRFASLTRGWSTPARLALSLVPLLGVAVDLPARRSAAEDAQWEARWQNHADFVNRIEREVGRGGMVFNLPVSLFPESAPLFQEDPYAPLMLFLTRPESGLRLSYGNMAGDYRDAWQQRCAQQAVPEMAAELRRLGFGGVVVSRAAYPDGGAALLAALSAAAGRPVTDAATGDLSFVSLGPPTPGTPRASPETANLSLQAGWWTMEFDARGLFQVWTRGNATLALFLDPDRAGVAAGGSATATVSFVVSSPVTRRLRVSCRGRALADLTLLANLPCEVEALPLTLRPGWNLLHLNTDLPPARRTDVPGDPREVALFITGLRAAGLTAASGAPTGIGQLALPAGATVQDADRANLRDATQVEVTDAANGGGHHWREFRAGDPTLPNSRSTRGLDDRPVREIRFLPNATPFRLVVRLAPGAAQVDYAAIASCLVPTFHGLAVEKVPGPEPRYQCLVGDGRKFLSVGDPVRLSPGESYTLTLQVSDGDLTLRFHGSDGLDQTIRHEGSECAELCRLPWRWGNWFAGGRPFAGQIELLSLGPPTAPGGRPDVPVPGSPGGSRP